MNDNLQNALRTLSRESDGAGAGLHVKANLMNEMRRRQRTARVRKWWPAVAAAALVVGVWLGLPKPGAPVNQQTTSNTTIIVDEPRGQPHVPVEAPAVVPEHPVRNVTYSPRTTSKQLNPLTPWYIHPGIPEARQGHMVYMDVGPETARLFGLASTGPMKAEVFLGDDGLARAIRLVRTTQIARGE